ncbi:MAG TPA: DUF362 domain-containing protein [Candidatus Lokiarchaeia archaeon]|nr:DUF362 domain-containing protein [Candidatus Lokiarchaeia archaeon]
MEDKTPVAITRINNDDVDSAVTTALELIDAKKIMRNDMNIVVLKVNLLSAKPPERAVCTHPEVVRAVIKWVKQFQPRRVVVTDSSGGGANLGDTERALEISGIKKVCEDEGVEAIPLEKTERAVYTVKDPLVLHEFPSSTLLKDADLIINLPKIKTHALTIFTCCVKNMLGTLPLKQKSKIHAQFPMIHDFSSALADIYSVSNPQLTIVDGYLCQEGMGPSAGDVVKLDMILAGFDGIALDAVACLIAGIDVNKVRHVKIAEQRGLGTTDLARIDIKGESIDLVKRPFKLPPGSGVAGVPMPKFLAKLVGNIAFRARVRFKQDKCVCCGTCWKNCPVNAITPPGEIKRGNIPTWNKHKCIACYCCYETCPHEAIELNVNMIRNLATSKLGIAAIAGLIIVILLAIWLFGVVF